jgi:hypothetical protein
MRTRHRRPDDDSGSLALAMLVMVAGVGLSAVLMSSAMQVVQGTRVEATRTSALQGARAGISGALANIRGAVDGIGMGLVSKLPCGTGPPQVTGTVATGTVQYKVSITYLKEDPTTHDDTWISAHGTPCATLLGALPSYAYVKSIGTDTSTGESRTLFGVYAFRTVVDANIAGGQIQVWHNAGDTHTLCVDAGASPGPGTSLHMQPCAPKGSGSAYDRQRFAYEPNLTISLASSSPMLCIDAGPTQKVNRKLVLELCGTTTKTQQRWSFNYASGFFGTTDNVTVNDYCWSVKKPDTAGTELILNDDHGGNGNPACNMALPNNVQYWLPALDVGAGAATLPNSMQLINFEAFSRCLDITNEDVTTPYQIVFQCKQSPTPNLVHDWNQAWHLPPTGVGPLWVHSTADGKDYCLTMPPLTSDPKLVVVKACIPLLTVAANQIWSVRGAATPTNDEKYRIEGLGDWAGYCLASLTDQVASQQVTKAGLLACNGDDVQKWNVVPSLNPSGLSGIGER